jgi:hypothetical protein
MSRLRALAAAGGLCLVVGGVGCAPAADEQVLTRFFEASRALDTTVLNRFATVVFSPRTDGSIQRFTVTDRGPEQRGPVSDSNREAAVRSLAAEIQDSELAGAAVEMIARQLTVEAEVRAPDGTVSPSVLVVTMARAAGTRAGMALEGQWIVTRLQRAQAARTLRGVASGPPR